MTMLTSPHSLPHDDASTTSSAPAAITVTDIVAVMQRSNHVTAFAAWSVATIAIGLVLQVDTVRAIDSRPAMLLLAGLVLPVLATAGRAAILLVRAERAARHAEMTDTGAISDASPAPAAPDLLDKLIAGLRQRAALARRAQIWAAGSGIAFLAWSLLAVFQAGG